MFRDKRVCLCGGGCQTLVVDHPLLPCWGGHVKLTFILLYMYLTYLLRKFPRSANFEIHKQIIYFDSLYFYRERERRERIDNSDSSVERLGLGRCVMSWSRILGSWGQEAIKKDCWQDRKPTRIDQILWNLVKNFDPQSVYTGCNFWSIFFQFGTSIVFYNPVNKFVAQKNPINVFPFWDNSPPPQIMVFGDPKRFLFFIPVFFFYIVELMSILSNLKQIKFSDKNSKCRMFLE